MAQYIRTAIDAGNLAETEEALVRDVYILRIVTPGEAEIYLSSGEEVEWNGDTYLAHSCEVGVSSWTGEGGQTLPITIYNENGLAADLIAVPQFYRSTIIIRMLHIKADGSQTDVFHYASGGVDDIQATMESFTFNVTAERYQSKFVPARYFGQIGCTHIPAENSTVFWNNTTYVLRRDY